MLIYEKKRFNFINIMVITTRYRQLDQKRALIILMNNPDICSYLWSLFD